MKPYETGICVCGRPMKGHPLICTVREIEAQDSGIAHLCSEKVAAGMLEALRELCDSFDADTLSWEKWVNAKKAINEALKR